MEQTMKITHHEKPWQHVIIDDFLSPERFEHIQNLAIEELGRYQVEGPNTPRGKYVRYTKDDLLPEVTMDIMKLLPHREYDDLVKLNHWSIMPPHVKYPPHVDNASRIHTFTFYVAPEKNLGTILCDNPSTNDDGDHGQPNQPTICEYPIEWKPNRAFVHNSRPKQWHRFESGDTHRINISVFYADPNKIKSHRQDFDYFID
tara:strand:- start:417 stop:1022 length:606 start_codon:yes stop_codon:yes gene_type:complete